MFDGGCTTAEDRVGWRRCHTVVTSGDDRQHCHESQLGVFSMFLTIDAPLIRLCDPVFPLFQYRGTRCDRTARTADCAVLVSFRRLLVVNHTTRILRCRSIRCGCRAAPPPQVSPRRGLVGIAVAPPVNRTGGLHLMLKPDGPRESGRLRCGYADETNPNGPITRQASRTWDGPRCRLTAQTSSAGSQRSGPHRPQSARVCPSRRPGFRRRLPQPA